MPEADYEEAVQLLIDHFGGQWQGLESDGRDEMERLLQDKLGYDHRRAHETIDAMIETGTLRYHREDRDVGDVPAATREADDDPVALPVVPIGNAGTSGTGSGFGGVIPVAGAMSGYWQIGREMDDTPGRAGQVQAS